MEKVITICGSGLCNESSELYDQCYKIGKLLAENGYTICSGGYKGIMEACCKGAKSVKGKTIGVLVESWENKPNDFLDEEVMMPNLMERLTELIALGDGYVILRGGSGTLVELSVILELMNKGMMKEKPIIFPDKFWNELIKLLKIDSDRLAEIINRNVIFINNIDNIPESFNEYFKNRITAPDYKKLKGIKY